MWKEELDKASNEDKLGQFDGSIKSLYWKELREFIETQVIEKIIDEIPEHIMPGTTYEDSVDAASTEDIKQQLKAKWLK